MTDIQEGPPQLFYESVIGQCIRKKEKKGGGGGGISGLEMTSEATDLKVRLNPE